jgi:long-chain acyl-CoA synthetase
MNLQEIFNKKNSIYEAWRECNSEHKDLPAIEYFGNQWTFKKANEMMDIYAKAFMRMLPDKTKSVTFCVPTLPSTIFAFYALNKIGIRANFVSHAILSSDAKKYIDEADAELVFVLDKFYPMVSTAICNSSAKDIVIVSLLDDVVNERALIQQIKKSSSELKRIPSFLIKQKLKIAFKKIKAKHKICGKNLISLQEFISLSNGCSREIKSTFTPNETAVVLYTGGSTGIPKGVEITNEAVIQLSKTYKDVIEIEAGNRSLILIPPNHPTSFMVCLIMPWFYGATHVLQPIYNKNTFANDLKSAKAQFALAAPSHYATLVSADLKAGDFMYLKCASSGGEPVSFELAEAINKSLEKAGAERPWLALGYGMSELGPTVFSSPNESALYNKVGKPIPGVEARIVDDDGNLLGDNEKGNLEVKTPYRMKGYFKQPKLTKAFFTEDGYAKTGDIAVRDDNGFYDVLGRATDSITTSDGTKIYLFDIERVIYRDFAVLEAEVIGLDNKEGLEKIPLVHIVLNPNYIGMDKEVILRVHKLCQEHLTKNEIPQGYKIRKAFGTNPISTKRDYMALMLERDGYFVVDGANLREVAFGVLA